MVSLRHLTVKLRSGQINLLLGSSDPFNFLIKNKMDKQLLELFKHTLAMYKDAVEKTEKIIEEYEKTESKNLQGGKTK